MHVDYRKWQPGVALAKNIILSQCPVCGDPCHARHTQRGHRYIHSGVITRKVSEKTQRASARFVPDKKTLCKQTKVEHLNRPTYPQPEATEARTG